MYFLTECRDTPLTARDIRRRQVEGHLSGDEPVWTDGPFPAVQIRDIGRLKPTFLTKIDVGFWGKRKQRHLAILEAAARRAEAKFQAEQAAIPVVTCPHCQGQSWTNRHETNLTGCILGFVMLLFAVPAALAWVGATGGISLAFGSWAPLVGGGVFILFLILGSLAQFFRQNHYRRCDGCGYSFPVK